jgi:cardiolipin synthase
MIALLKNNLANIFTVMRLIFAVWLVFLALYSSQLILMFLVVLICGILDAIDGWAARRFNAETDIGAFLDRLADKIFICPVIVILAWCYWPRLEISSSLKLLTESLVAVVVFLEVILMSSGVFGAIKGLDISSNKWGKAKMVLQSATVLAWFLLLILDRYFPEKILFFTLYVLINLLLIGAIGLAVKSLDGYWQRYRNFIC